jgi:hypothetical protein
VISKLSFEIHIQNEILPEPCPASRSGSLLKNRDSLPGQGPRKGKGPKNRKGDMEEDSTATVVDDLNVSQAGAAPPMEALLEPTASPGPAPADSVTPYQCERGASVQRATCGAVQRPCLGRPTRQHRGERRGTLRCQVGPADQGGCRVRSPKQNGPRLLEPQGFISNTAYVALSRSRIPVIKHSDLQISTLTSI